MLGIGHVHIGNDIHDAPVGLLGQALILAAVARLHVEDGDVQPLGADDAEAGVGVAQHQNGIGLTLRHQLVAFRNDVAHGLAQVGAHGVEIDLRVLQLQIAEEYPVEVVVIVLPGVGQDGIEVLPAFGDHGGQTDDLRPGAHNNQQLQSAVFLPGHVAVIHSLSSYTGSKKVSGRLGSKGSLAHITVTRFSVSERLMMLWV